MRPSGRPNRKIRLPLRYVDELPPQPPIIPRPIFDIQQPFASIPSSGSPPLPTLSVDIPTNPVNASTIYETPPNAYGVHRLYRSGQPSYTPDDLYSLRQSSDGNTFSRDPDSDGNRPWWGAFGSSSQNIQEPYFAPFMSASVFHLMNWFYTGSNLKSLGKLDRLVTDVILANDFRREDFVGFRSSQEAK